MKIAHIVCSYPPYYGGMGNTVFSMASTLISRGHEVTVLTPGIFEDREIKPIDATPELAHEESLQKNIDHAKRLKPSLSYGNAARMPQVKKDLEGFDLVHLHYPFFGTAGMVRKFKLTHPEIPLVITYHMDTRAPGWKGLIFKYYNAYYLPKILRSADKLIASSIDYLESSQAAGLYEEDKSKWIGISLGVDIEKFKPRQKPLALFKKYNLDPEFPTVLFVGGMDAAHYFKGVDILLKALLVLKRRNIQVQAVLVGDGELREGYQLMANGYQLSDRVVFAGYVSDEELPYYYNMADLFVLPSINTGEAFGMVLLEAMASGVPVLAGDLPGVRTVAVHGGITFEPGNARDLAEGIMGFFAQKEDLVVWREKVRRVAEEKYSWSKIVDKLEEVYMALV